MTAPYTSCGKQLLRGRKHIADCCDPETAEALAILLNSAEIVFWKDDERMERAQRVLWPNDTDEAGKFTVEAV
ncbi:hypothetical protein F1640_15155 [Novosphingobium sp. NBM11]|uniref:hypothetical protein n=1 Tax=Novosphingobium sp. NBM11 TaxID=2596914 RepID=UPI0018927354|nr:hypothetical protein [Novosphingobium sp. NBM11]MBF5091324.1 hypothetical protein [Novosphingobium sp. NBM11]